jgi:hypothetical protein
VLTKRKWVDLIFAGVGLLVLSINLAHFREVGLKNENINALNVTDILNKVEPDAMVTCFSPMTCLSLIYEVQTAKVRPDVMILPYDYQPNERVVDVNNLAGVGYDSYPWILYDYIVWNVDKRPIYAINMINNYYDLLGFDFGFLHYIPLGNFAQITKAVPESMPDVAYPLSERLIKQKTAGWDYEHKAIKAYWTRNHVLNATVYLKMGLRQLAYREMNIATTIFFGMEEKDRDEITKLRESTERLSPNEYYRPGYQVEKADYIMGEAAKIMAAGAKTRAVQVAQGAVTVEPENIKARINWADALESTGSTPSAIVEYKNVLKLDPENEEAKEKLDKLDQVKPDEWKN